MVEGSQIVIGLIEPLETSLTLENYTDFYGVYDSERIQDVASELRDNSRAHFEFDLKTGPKTGININEMIKALGGYSIALASIADSLGYNLKVTLKLDDKQEEVGRMGFVYKEGNKLVYDRLLDDPQKPTKHLLIQPIKGIHSADRGLIGYKMEANLTNN